MLLFACGERGSQARAAHTEIKYEKAQSGAEQAEGRGGGGGGGEGGGGGGGGGGEGAGHSPLKPPRLVPPSSASCRTALWCYGPRLC
eukprot:1107539-Rhodomonas_salina.1